MQTVEVSGILAKSVRVSHRKHHKKCLACLQQCGVAGFRLGQVANIDRSTLGELWFQYRKDLHSNFVMLWKTELVVQEVDSCLFYLIIPIRRERFSAHQHCETTVSPSSLPPSGWLQLSFRPMSAAWGSSHRSGRGLYFHSVVWERRSKPEQKEMSDVETSLRFSRGAEGNFYQGWKMIRILACIHHLLQRSSTVSVKRAPCVVPFSKFSHARATSRLEILQTLNLRPVLFFLLLTFFFQND